MRRFLQLLFLLASITLLGQSHEIVPDVAHWKPSDFPKSITKAEVYEFKVKKGKVKKDSLLIGSANLEGNSVSGIYYSLYCTTHIGCEREFNEYKKVYSPSGKLLHSKHQPVNKNVKKDKYSLGYDYTSSESIYKYDQLGNKIEEKNLFKYYSLSLDKKTKDTILISLIIQPTTFSYMYNGRDLLSHYTQKDSVISRNMFLDIDTTEVSASHHYEPKYKNVDNIYNESGQLSCRISYTREGEFHTKKYYFYDEKSRIIKQIDSTGWYYREPYLKSMTTYDYTEKGLIKAIEGFEVTSHKWSKTTIHYNLQNLETSHCRQYEDAEYCDYYNYTFNGHKVVSIIHTNNEGVKTYSYFKYNSDGLIIEEKDVINDKITSLVRYYYK